MDTVSVSCQSKSYNVLIGTSIGETIFELVGEKRACIVTDSQVYSIYKNRMQDLLPQAEIFVFKKGEKSKNENTLFDILDFLLENNFDRRSVVVAFGGGVVGDVAGFASSIYMRGIDCIQVPTTLLSQVDSSVGGKTAINMNHVKNVVGSFCQPMGVIVDTEFLSTLEDDDIVSGVGEILKTACLDSDLYDYVKENITKIFSLDKDTMEEVIARCIKIKARIVEQDETEKNGLRKELNLGHTIGHAYESSGVWGAKSHGECVLCGIYVESLIAKHLKRIDEEYCKDLLLLVEKCLGYIPEINDVDKMVRISSRDKKNQDGYVSFILPVDKGEADEVYLHEEELEDILRLIAKQL